MHPSLARRHRQIGERPTSEFIAMCTIADRLIRCSSLSIKREFVRKIIEHPQFSKDPFLSQVQGKARAASGKGEEALNQFIDALAAGAERKLSPAS
jgi:hypothetical protein